MPLPKPPACEGCPLYADGLGFVPDALVEDAEVTILGQNPGVDEEAGRRVVGLDERNRPHYESCPPQPFIGRTGYQMDTKFLPLAGLERGKVSVLNVVKCRAVGDDGKKTNKLPSKKVLMAAVAHCTVAHLRVPESTRLVLAQGGLAWDWTQGQVGLPEERKLTISTWRGCVGPSRMEMAKPWRNSVPSTMSWSQVPVTERTTSLRSGNSIPVFALLHLADLFKDARMTLPSRQDWKRIPAVLAGAHPKPLPPRFVISPSTPLEAIYDWFTEAETHAPYVAIDTEFVPDTSLLTIIGVGYPGAAGVIHGIQLQWIGNRDITSRTRAVFRDCLELLTASKKVILWNAQADLPVMDKNLGLRGVKFEDGMLAHAALWVELPHDLDFCASVYSDYYKPRREVVGYGLDKNWGDVVATIACWQALETSLAVDPGARSDYRDQKLSLVPILLAAHTRGLRVNKERVLTAIPEYQARQDEAQALVEAVVGWPLNLGSPVQLAHWLYMVEGLSIQKNRKTKKASVDDDAVAELRNLYHPIPDYEEEKDGVTTPYIMARIDAGAHPALETRVLYAGAQQVLSHYLLPLLRGTHDCVDRIHPTINQHTQDNRRWSTSNPPLAQLPDDLRDIIIPDVGEVWIKWDWDAAEPRMQMAVMRSKFLEDALGQAWDLNTLALCDLMGWAYPPDRSNPHVHASCTAWKREHHWGGKDDARRRLAKAGRLALDYGKRDLSDMPGIYLLGLDKATLKRAGDLILKSDPDKRRWMGDIRSKVRKGENISRDWTGARRVFLGTRGEALVREWLNHPFQSGVASLRNLTIIELAQGVPNVSLAFDMHDADWMHVSRLHLRDVFARVREIVTQERNINGYVTRFPATFKIIDDQGVEHEPEEILAA